MHMAIRSKETGVITASYRLAEKGLDSSTFNFPIAILFFFKGMADIEWWNQHNARLKAKRVNHPKLDNSPLHWGKVIQWPVSVWNIEKRGIPIVFVGPILFGPLCAIILEELKVFGLKYAIGIGAVGSFSKRLQIGEHIVAHKSIVSDGTSRSYTNKKHVFPSRRLLALAEKVALKQGTKVKKTCTWQSDALYRESTRKRNAWLKKGAECVNGDTSTLYAVSEAIGIESVYFGYVSDSSTSGKWTGWGGMWNKNKARYKTKRPKSWLEILEDLAIGVARETKKGKDRRDNRGG